MTTTVIGARTHGKRGNFFAVDCRCWAKACALSMNAAVAYLVLARFSGPDNRTTAASRQAIEKYTSISRSRAGRSIEALIKAGLIEQTVAGKRPRYFINPHVGEVENDPEQTHDPEWIWLPNELVTSAAGEPSPVERLRQTQDVMALRLLIDLYHAHNLREDEGVGRAVLWQHFKRVRVGEQGPFVVWGFHDASILISWNDITSPHKRTKLSDDDLAAGTKQSVDLARRLELLERLGLMEWVPWLVEGESPEAELIHPLEGDLGALARDAALTMLTTGQQARAADQRLTLAPVLSHFTRVQLVGVARLRYRPKTSATAAWWADYNGKCTRYREEYSALLGRMQPARNPQQQQQVAVSR
jgi:hypothetical protein